MVPIAKERHRHPVRSAPMHKYIKRVASVPITKILESTGLIPRGDFENCHKSENTEKYKALD